MNIENTYGKEVSKRKRPDSKRGNNIDNLNKNDVSLRYQSQQSGTESLNCTPLNSRKGNCSGSTASQVES